MLICVSVLFTGCQKNDTPQGGVVDESGNEQIVDVQGNGDVLNDNDADVVVDLNEADAPKSDIKIEGEAETVVEQKIGLGAEAFISGKYYLEGVVYSSGEEMPVILATDGENYQFTANYSGIAFGMLLLGADTYVVLPTKKQYTVLSERLIKSLDLEDSLGVDDFQIIKNETETTAQISAQYAVSINGQSGLCSVYKVNDSEIKLYTIGDELIQVENYEADGTMTMQIVVDKISAQIPADQLTLKGLDETSVTGFIQSFFSLVTL